MLTTDLTYPPIALIQTITRFSREWVNKYREVDQVYPVWDNAACQLDRVVCSHHWNSSNVRKKHDVRYKAMHCVSCTCSSASVGNLVWVRKKDRGIILNNKTKWNRDKNNNIQRRRSV